jgi:branched-chain amino acid aminotransferase
VSGASESGIAGPVAWVDGRLLPADAPALPVSDRGFQLGDGVFETLRVRNGIPIELEAHLRRLREGLATLEIRLAWSDAEVAGAISTTVAVNAPADAAVRITVSRGAPAARGLLPAGWHDLRATLVVQAWPNGGPDPSLVDRGVRAIVSTARRDPANPLAGVKTVSRADYVWTKREADRAGADDAITLTLDGHVAEATSANLAVIVGDVLRTPPLATGALAGTTRDWLLSADGAAALGLAAGEAAFGLNELLAADEAILCSSVAGILPLVELDRQPIGDGRPGPWARRLRDAREAWVAARSGG